MKYIVFIICLINMSLAENFDTLEQLEEQAIKGDVDAQYFLGVNYDNQESLDEDPEKAHKWYRLAAEQGHGKAQHLLGLIYSGPDGKINPIYKIPYNYAEAEKWFKLSASQGYPEAEYDLGMLYASQSEQWLEKACKSKRVYCNQDID